MGKSWEYSTGADEAQQKRKKKGNSTKVTKQKSYRFGSYVTAARVVTAFLCFVVLFGLMVAKEAQTDEFFAAVKVLETTIEFLRPFAGFTNGTHSIM